MSVLQSENNPKPWLADKALVAVLALSYGFVLANLPPMAFRDRETYLYLVLHSYELLQVYSKDGPLRLLVNEPLWLIINSGLSQVFETQTVLIIFIMVPAALTAWLVLYNNRQNIGWVLLFFLIPQILINNITHLRQGTAISVFLTGWYCKKPVLKYSFMLAAALIHSSFFFVLLLLSTSKFIEFMRPSVLLQAVLFALLGIATGVALNNISEILGAHQAEFYRNVIVSVSGLGFAFWLGILSLMFFNGEKYLNENLFVVGSIIFYLGTYFLTPVSARIFESVLILVLVSGLKMDSRYRQLFLSAIIGYGGLQWALRLGQPSFGF